MGKFKCFLIILLTLIHITTRLNASSGDNVPHLLLKKVSVIFAAKVFRTCGHYAPEPARTVLSLISEVTLETLTSYGNRDEFEQLNSSLIGLNESVIQISEQMKDLKISVDEVLKELRFHTLLEYDTELKAEVDHFQQIVLGYGSDKEALWIELEKFVDSYKSKNIENKILNYLNEASSTSKSFVSTLVEFARRNQETSKAKFKSSPNKLVHDFYAAIMLKIFASNEFLLNCYTLKNLLKPDVQFENNKKFVEIRNSKTLAKILESMKSARALINNENDLISYNNFASTVKLELKNVLQLFLDVSRDLKPRKSIWFRQYSCSDIDNVRHNRNGCSGVVRGCFDTGMRCAENGSLMNIPVVAKSFLFGNSLYKDLRLTSDPDRIYGRNASDKSFIFTAKKSCSWLDVICACVCDQTDHSRTERKLYGGEIKAPDNYVITGVRFSKFQGVIYLQGQIGKLMDGASIQASSVTWMEPPTNILSNFFTFNYSSRRFLLDDLHFDDSVVTGYQFYYYFNQKTFVSTDALKLYGRRLVKPELKSMESEVNILMSDNFKNVIEKNLESKIPGIADHSGSFVIAKGNTFVKFGASSEAVDFGQTFVPFFDGVDEVFDVPSPLSGIGFLHYTNDDRYAGFIKPSVKSFDFRNVMSYYTNYLSEEMALN